MERVYQQTKIIYIHQEKELLIELNLPMLHRVVFLFFNEKILHILTDNYQKIFSPGPDIVVDETIVS